MTCDCHCTGLALDANGKVSTEHYCPCEFGSIRRMSANRKAIMAYRNAGSEPAVVRHRTCDNCGHRLVMGPNGISHPCPCGILSKTSAALDAKDRLFLRSLLLGLILGACATVIVLKLTGVIQ